MTPIIEMKPTTGAVVTEAVENKVEEKVTKTPMSLKERVLLAIKQIRNRKFDNAQFVYGIIMNSTKTVGNKTYAYVPIECCIVDERFQRDDCASIDKVCRLIRKWDKTKMDALKAVPHPEENRFSIVDGFHRLVAGIVVGESGLECEIVMGLSEDPKERLIQEATIFATQNDQVDTLSPVQKHKANVLRSVTENVILEELIKKYSIPLKTNPSHGRVTIGHLAGYTQALAVAKIQGKQMLDDIFYIICESRWNIAHNGLSANVISPVANMFKFHPTYREQIIKELIEYFKPIEPANFFASAMDKYPERKEKERLALYLEDYLCCKIGFERTYIHRCVMVTDTTKVA